jgi:hypothetical protein
MGDGEGRRQSMGVAGHGIKHAVSEGPFKHSIDSVVTQDPTDTAAIPCEADYKGEARFNRVQR